MRYDAAYGVIVILTSPTPEYLLIGHTKGHWGFPKGHKEGSETDQEAALRELAEETGLTDVTVVPEVSFQEEYVFQGRDGIPVHKTNRYFVSLITPPAPEVRIQESEVVAAGWFSFPEAVARFTFAEGQELLRRCQTWFEGSRL